ncbi:MAG TPA: enoyl-CoA hydratase/isomerase family protein [Minicystis sp.]|nr:enoyl-CoA hydratase/isomerase family protein [Minicystis sp.]
MVARDGDVEVLTLEHGRATAIDAAFSDALVGALDAAAAGPSRALVLAAAGKAFSGGLDLAFTARLDRAAMGAFVDAFEAMFERLAACPKPIVAAVHGAAFAGGAILALACDARVVAPGVAFAVNEVRLGIPFPAAAFEIARAALPSAALREALVAGATFDAARLAALGVGRVAGPAGALADAVELARVFAAAEPAAAALVKLDLLAELRGRIAGDRASRRERFLDAWFASEARARVAARFAG